MVNTNNDSQFSGCLSISLKLKITKSFVVNIVLGDHKLAFLQCSYENAGVARSVTSNDKHFRDSPNYLHLR